MQHNKLDLSWPMSSNFCLMAVTKILLNATIILISFTQVIFSPADWCFNCDHSTKENETFLWKQFLWVDIILDGLDWEMAQREKIWGNSQYFFKRRINEMYYDGLVLASAFLLHKRFKRSGINASENLHLYYRCLSM